MLSAVDGLDTLPIKSIRQKKMALMASVLLVVFVRTQEREDRANLPLIIKTRHDFFFFPFLSNQFASFFAG